MPFDFEVMFILGGIIAATVIAMSVFFIVKAVKRAKEIGMDIKVVKRTVRDSAIFSIVPSIPIVIGVGIMMSGLGLAIPWIRLTVIGALQYEILAADAAGVFMADPTAQMIATALTIMTFAILSGPLFNLFFFKKYQGKLDALKQKNEKMLNMISGALLSGLLGGMIAFMIANGALTAGGVITPSVEAGTGIAVSGLVTLAVLATSVVIMAICGVLIKIFKWNWLENFALPLTILGSLGLAFVYIPIM